MIRRSLNVDGLLREKVREKVLHTWLEEDPGVGQHRYDVEVCKDESAIYLLRPANLNKGCDFIIVSENFLKYKNGNDKPPKHDDIFDLIILGVGSDRYRGEAFHSAAKDVYECLSPDEAIAKHAKLKIDPGYKLERALKLLKWLWIEQDVTYWSGKGRGMLWDGLHQMMTKIILS